MPKFSAVAIRIRFGYWRIHTVSRGLLVRDTWRRIGQVDVLILCHDVDRALTIDGKAYSQLLDPVREELIEAGHAVGVVAHRFSVLTGEKAHGSPHSCNRASLVSAVANRLARVVPWMRITDGVSERAIRFWEKVLQLTEAKAVLLIGAPPELCIAANRLQVPVVETLHGYGYHRIPFGYAERVSEARPAMFIAFDDLSYETFVAFFGADLAFKAQRQSLANQVKERATVVSDLHFKVLVTIGWKTDGGACLVDANPEQIISPELANAVRISQPNIQWFLRPHPVMMRNASYRSHLNLLRDFVASFPNCASTHDSSRSLDVLLEDVHCHVTMFSETAYEASFRGISTLFLSPALMPGGCLEGTFKDLVDSGHAEMQPDFTGQQIVDWIQRQASSRRQAPVIMDHQRASDVVMDIFGRAKPGRL